MSLREMTKLFAYGSALPAFLMPFLLTVISASGYTALTANPFFHWLPFAWGAWHVISHKTTLSHGVAGAILGVLLALYGVFVAQIPQQAGLPIYFVLIGMPILYGLVWHFLFPWMEGKKL